MGPQDALAVVAAGRALDAAGLRGRPLGERAGLYLAVGHIPFEGADVDDLVEASTDEGGFSMERFSTDGCASVNPLLTFRCLSNMPAYHVSVNFDIQGPYFVTYPGAGQFYLALEEALEALAAGRVEVALVAGVAHQRNFLVAHHFRRLPDPVPRERLVDAAGCLILERASDLQERSIGRAGRLIRHDLSYRPHHPFEETVPFEEAFEGADAPEGEMGAASLPVWISRCGAGTIHHHLHDRDGIRAGSTWEIR